MNRWINKYMLTVYHLFPLLEKPERQYIKHLRSGILDYYQDSPPQSMETILSDFGTPEDAVGSYLESVDADEMIKKIRHAQIWQKVYIGLIVLLLIAFVLFILQLWVEYRNYHQLLRECLGYFVETFE